MEKRYPWDVLRVRYEDLTRTPTGKIDRILRFCGLEEDENVITFAEEVLRPVVRKRRSEAPPVLESRFREIKSELEYDVG